MKRYELSGENYQVGGYKQGLATFIGVFMLVFFMALFMGDIIFDYFGGIDKMPQSVKNINNILQENRI